MISFNTTPEDFQAIIRIAERAGPLYERLGETKTHLLMDLTACHANGCKLDLNGLADADDFNFAHDIFGIRRHINRETGKLEDAFIPRYAVQ